MIRPGPDAMPAGCYPGGIVLHAYSITTGELVLASLLDLHGDLSAQADRDADQAAKLSPGGICLVAWDGDSGRRWSPDVWRTALERDR